MTKKTDYLVKLEYDDEETLYVSIWDSPAGEPERARMVTSWRTRSVADAMYDAGHELKSLIGYEYY